MLAKEKERQFCELRDELRERIIHLKVDLPNANGESKNIRERISILEERARRIENYFLKGNLNVFKTACDRIYSRFKGTDYDSVYSEVIYQVWNNIGGFDYNRARFSTFVNMVAKTKAIDISRCSSINKQKQLSSQDQDSMYDLEDKKNREPLQLLLDKENRDVIINCVSLLPEREKVFVYLRYLNNPEQRKAGRKAREILGVSKATISGIKKLALVNLRFYLLDKGVA